MGINNKHYWLLGIVGGCIIVTPLILYFCHFHDGFSLEQTDWGSFGSYYGSIGTVLTSLLMVFVTWKISKKQEDSENKRLILYSMNESLDNLIKDADNYFKQLCLHGNKRDIHSIDRLFNKLNIDCDDIIECINKVNTGNDNKKVVIESVNKYKSNKNRLSDYEEAVEQISVFIRKYILLVFITFSLFSCSNESKRNYFYIEQAKDGEVVHMKRDCANHVEFYGIRELFGYDFLCGKCVTDDDYRFIERCIERNTNIFKKRSELWEVLNRLGETDCSNARQFYLKMEKALYRRDVYKTLEELGYDVGNWVEDEGFMTEFEKYKRIRTE